MKARTDAIASKEQPTNQISPPPAATSFQPSPSSTVPSAPLTGEAAAENQASEDQDFEQKNPLTTSEESVTDENTTEVGDLETVSETTEDTEQSADSEDESNSQRSEYRK